MIFDVPFLAGDLMIQKLILILILAIGFVFAVEPIPTRSLSTGWFKPSIGGQSFLRPCRVPNLDEEVRCGKYDVYEDRAAKAGRQLSLNIVVVPALSTTPAPDP